MLRAWIWWFAGTPPKFFTRTVAPIAALAATSYFQPVLTERVVYEIEVALNRFQPVFMALVFDCVVILVILFCFTRLLKAMFK